MWSPGEQASEIDWAISLGAPRTTAAGAKFPFTPWLWPGGHNLNSPAPFEGAPFCAPKASPLGNPFLLEKNHLEKIDFPGEEGVVYAPSGGNNVRLASRAREHRHFVSPVPTV
jgi:hypothetical protein